MSEQHHKKSAGIWLDTSKAMIIAQDETGTGEYSIHNSIKGRTKHSGGSEHTMNNAKQSEDLKFFKSLAALLLPFDEILIFGPGQSQEQLQRHLQLHVQFNNKKMTTDSSGQLTDNQAIATVRDFFKSAS